MRRAGRRLRSGRRVGVCVPVDSLVSAISAGERLAFYMFYLSVHFFLQDLQLLFCALHTDIVKMHVGVYIITSSCLRPICMDEIYGGVGPQL